MGRFSLDYRNQLRARAIGLRQRRTGVQSPRSRQGCAVTSRMPFDVWMAAMPKARAQPPCAYSADPLLSSAHYGGSQCWTTSCLRPSTSQKRRYADVANEPRAARPLCERLLVRAGEKSDRFSPALGRCVRRNLCSILRRYVTRGEELGISRFKELAFLRGSPC